MNKMTILTVILSVVLLIGLALSGCNASGNEEPTSTDNSSGEELKPVEVREYQGEKLSSVNDFIENTIKGPQYIDEETYHLEITGLVQSPKSNTYDEVINDYNHYKKVVTLNCVAGWSVTVLWEGLLVKDLINEAGLLPAASVIIFYAYDGYTTSFPLDYVMNNDILMAYKINGITIPPEGGFPFELVAESKWGYKWIKWITKIELSDDVNYRGYWESRGYSDNADLNEGFFQ